MALHIEFTRKGGSAPTPLNTIDEELCTLLGVSVDNTRYVHYWLDTIGSEACIEGQELGTQALRDKVMSWGIPPLIKILKYLEDNYTAHTWAK